jgi:glucose-1-phosphate thymidylyltransferase
MKIIIPMAGRGSRLRPHTLTIPKPLIPIAGKPIVQRLVEDLARSYEGTIEEVAFVIGDFGAEVEESLNQIARGIGAKASIYSQDKPLGTAHAILCAGPSLSGNCIVAFADTLFRASFSFDPEADGLIWVQKVADPSAFGVVKLSEEGTITDFVEKPKEFVSDLAIVGIYYFKDGDNLREELQAIIDQDIRDKGEYQLTTALESMKQKGIHFRPQTIDEWLDCGNKDAVVYTNQRILEFSEKTELIAASAQIENSVIIPPCYIGENAVLRNSVLGPHVSIGDNSTVENSVITNSLVQEESRVKYALLENSMIGNQAEYSGKASDISIGDFCRL